MTTLPGGGITSATSDSNSTTPTTLDDLTTRMTQFFQQNQNLNQPVVSSYDVATSSVGTKLDGTNYGLWSQVLEMFISGRDKLGYINGDLSEPAATDPAFRRWRTENAIVKGWLINAMDPSLIPNFIRFPTAYQVWRSAATTYYDGTDTSQVYDLKKRVTTTRQGGGSLEAYYNTLQGLWREIDFRRPNPMKCPVDIQEYNNILQEDRVYTFLDGLDDRLDKTRSDVLHMSPFPTVEQAYAHVRREDTRQSVMLVGHDSPAVAMASTGVKSEPSLQLAKPGPVSDRRWASKDKKPTAQGLGCTHCNSKKHTRDTCFKLHGYPDWWEDFQAKKKKDSSGSTGRAALATTAPQLSILPIHELPPETTSDGSGIGSAYFANTNDSCSGWIVDSGATDHMTFTAADFGVSTPPQRTNIVNANGATYPVTGAGNVVLSPSLSLNNTLLVPSLSSKLLSVGRITEELNCVALMYPTFCLFQDILTKTIIGRGTRKGGLYYVDDLVAGQVHNVRSSAVENEKQLWLWHHRMGHPSFGYMKHVLPQLFNDSNKNSTLHCDTCTLAKSHRVSFPLSSTKSSKPFDLIHSDVWGPSPITTSSGARWFVTFVDDCSRMTWVYLLKNKSEVYRVFRIFHAMIKTQYSADIRILRSDNGGEYVNHEFQTYFTDHGLRHETSCSQTPQQNGVAERKNRHLLETARALLIGANMPQLFWDSAVTTAVHLINRLPSKILKFRTPLQELGTHVPLPSSLIISPRVYGCTAFVHLHKNQRTKLDPCAVRCVFLGYAATKKGYRCYHPSSKRTYITMDVTFVESDMYYSVTPSSALEEDNNNHDPLKWCVCISNGEELTAEEPISFSGADPALENTAEEPCSNSGGTDRLTTLPVVHTAADSSDSGSADPTEPVVPSAVCDEVLQTPLSHVPAHASTQNLQEVNNSVSQLNTNVTTGYHLPFRKNRGKPPTRYSPDTCGQNANYPIADHVTTEKLSDPLKAFVHQVSSCDIPTGIHAALADPNWSRAIQEEMSALQQNKTWSLVSLPTGKKTVGCRWVFTIKYKADGKIERYKARLVAKGYTQTYGVDYRETFSPVAKLNSVRVLLSLAANLNWPLHQFDVKNAFLHGNLEEEVYMDLPPGYTVGSSGVVCKLQRALYGLKQSPRAWFGRFSMAMEKYGFHQSHSDHTLFLKHRRGKITALIIYVDDMIITGNDVSEIAKLEEQLGSEFEMKNLGGLKYFLGIEVARSNRGIFLSQRKYVLDLLAEVGMLDCKPIDTPMAQNDKLGEFQHQVPTNKERYQRLVGKLIYLSHTRPDIAYAVSVVSQYMHNPSKDHMDAVIRILRYLKSAPGRGIMYSKNGHVKIDGYTDADWAGCVDDRKSMAGYFTFVGGNLVTWRSKKQNVVALSSAESEFRGISKGICELLWLRRLMTELGFAPTTEMNLFCDNKAAIAISHNPIQHDRTKHIEVDRHFIKHNLVKRIVRFPFVRSEDQLADMLTKAISSQNFYSSLDKLGIRDIYAPT